jgi:hypothetical protein
MEADERLPGLTFWRESASQLPSDAHKAKGRVVLTADIDDLGMWDEIVRQFDGMRIYAAGDFKEAMIEALQKDKRSIETKLKQKEVEANTELEHLRAENSMLLGERARTEAELSYLRQLKAQLDALSVG